ncbi:MAG TPA: hypothetical protein VFG72_06935 [Marmoricola sp.]|nr:hypothetical protein [Marmoricola sp.]
MRALLAQLTGRTIDESVTVLPTFDSEFGKNLTLGKGVFINIGCRFQDTGGITIGEGALIGHGSTVTTLNHGVDPDRRGDMIPAPVTIGRKAWLGANVPANAICGMFGRLRFGSGGTSYNLAVLATGNHDVVRDVIRAGRHDSRCV